MTRLRAALGAGAGAVVTTAAAVAAVRRERQLLDRWDQRRSTAAVEPPPAPPADTERTVTVDDGARLRVSEWGSGPPVVLVHGITATSEDWLPVLPHLLAAGHRVVAVDQRGHGASTLGRDRCDTERLVADLAHVLDELDVEDAVLVGHSLGGYVSLALAALHPERMRQRVDVVVALGATHTGRGLRELATLASVASPLTPRFQRSDPHGAVVTGLVVFGARPDRPAVDDVRYRWAACDGATRRCFARHLAGESISALLPRIDVPVVVSRGTRDHVVTARRNRALVRRLRRVRQQDVNEAGHALLSEQPAAVAAVILDAARQRG